MQKCVHTSNITVVVYVRFQVIQMRLLPPKQKYTLSTILYKFFQV